MWQPDYYRYWGKASPEPLSQKAAFHLLVYHSLDVAAVGKYLLEFPQFSLRDIADEMGWPVDALERAFLFFLAAHDIGKFSRAFQALVPQLSADLVAPIPSKRYVDVRHDTLGWLLWDRYLAAGHGESICPEQGDSFWSDLMKITAGHHGKPPQESLSGGNAVLDAYAYFDRSDMLAAAGFLQAVVKFLPLDTLPEPGRRQAQALHRHGWRLAGLAVLADWLGSNQAVFQYHATPMSLDEYWQSYALPRARQAIHQAGLHISPVRTWGCPAKLFDYLSKPTPLQSLAMSLPLGEGPQLFLLEDVTGAGKTEAALMLAYRLMTTSCAHGLYFGLPTMATANQMFQRVGEMYRRLYEVSAQPSLVLAHGARHLVDGFRQSIVREASSGDRDYREDERSATSQCSAWLADHRKKALLAEVGVGTLDQALLSVLPVRHQSLRALGLAGKVLIADEVHAFDPYMRVLLAQLLTLHASQGGSAILLSATLPCEMRVQLVQAFKKGRGDDVGDVPVDMRYPLLTHGHHTLQVYACDTRDEVRRSVEVRWLHEEKDVHAFILAQASLGRSVCWIRNTVGDARAAYADLVAVAKAGAVTLFHSRYAMGDRLEIEARVLQMFGKHSNAAERVGHILVATQVVEQSLDLDFDVMVSDLAPIDLLIQRAGRLHRHVRDEAGNPAAAEGRDAPVLHIHAPEYTETPAATWFSARFPKAAYVYENVGALWLTQQALRAAGKIISPGVRDESGAVRSLVEAVYGEQLDKVPDALKISVQKYEGVSMGDRSLARFNTLQLNKGYCVASAKGEQWYEDVLTPTRLGDETVTAYLACWDGERLRPWVEKAEFAWEYSSVQVRAVVVKALAPEVQMRFEEVLRRLRAENRLLDEPALILPLVVDEAGVASAAVLDGQDRLRKIRYDREMGLM